MTPAEPEYPDEASEADWDLVADEAEELDLDDEEAPEYPASPTNAGATTAGPTRPVLYPELEDSLERERLALESEADFELAAYPDSPYEPP